MHRFVACLRARLVMPPLTKEAAKIALVFVELLAPLAASPLAERVAAGALVGQTCSCCKLRRCSPWRSPRSPR